jgi:hypothetical protein
MIYFIKFNGNTSINDLMREKYKILQIISKPLISVTL